MAAGIRHRSSLWLALFGLLGALLAGITATTPATAAPITFVVDNTTDDGGLSACTLAPGDCSLRGAVTAANANPGADSIAFLIPAIQCPGGVCPITLASGPIDITETLDVDATTQPPNSSPQANVCATATEPSHMRILLTSDPTGADYDILNIDHTGDGSTIRGFAFATAAMSPSGIGAVKVLNGSGHHIACNHIAVDAAGTTNAPGAFSFGVLIESGAAGVIVGTNGDGVDDIGERNLFGSASSGAVFVNINVDNWIAGNYFGITADGAGVLTLPGHVLIRQSSASNLVGTNEDGVSDEIERNYFAGLLGVELDYNPTPAPDNRIVGNTFGMTPSGDLVPTDTGIEVKDLTADDTGTEIHNNTFGSTETGIYVEGDEAGAELLIAGNTFGGTSGGSPFGTLGSIVLRGAGAHVIRDNLIRNSFAGAIYLFDTAAIATGSQDNCLVGNADTVNNQTGVVAGFENNWWGSVDGPSGSGPGSGDPVGVDVDFTPWLVNPPAACNTAPGADDATFAINAGAPAGTVVGTVTAADDGTDLTYAITAGDPGGVFAIGTETGEITMAGVPDYPATTSYGLTVEVSDPLLSDTATITIDLTNAAPVVDDASFSVAEDAAVGGAVGTVNASDTDGDALGFAVTAGDPGGLFAIDNDGRITVAKVLDYETAPSHTLTVTVDDGFEADTATVAVSVTDVVEVPTFVDVPESHTFYDDIEWLAASGITRGCNPPTNDMFCPDAGVTRGQMAAFLHRALGDVLIPGAAPTFTDIAGSVFADDIEWLGAVGVTLGCNPPTNDMYCPGAGVTRGQMAAFLVRAFGLTETGGLDFVDDDGSVFEDDIEKLAAAGITRGCNPPTNDMFCPNDPVTRAQMAAFLRRAMET